MIKKLFESSYASSFKIPIFLLFLLAIKIPFLFETNFWFSLLSDLFLIPVTFLIVRKFIELNHQKNFSQIQLLTGFIISEILFILFSETSLFLLGPTLKGFKGLFAKPTLFVGIISGFFSLVYILFISIILSILTILFFSKQRGSIKNYYVITIIYFILSSLGSNFEKHYNIEWIKFTFGLLTIIFFIFLTYFNKWVIYLNRKDKLKVIGLCIVLLGIIIFAMSKSGSREQLEELISLFSVSTVAAYNLIFGMALVYAIILPILTIFQLPTTDVIEKKTSEVETLQDLSQMISRVLDINQLTSFIIQTISKISKSENVWLCIFENQNKCSHFAHSKNELIDPEKIKSFVENKLSSINELKIIEINNFDRSSNLIDIHLLIYLPLIHNEKFFGYILIGFDKSNKFEKEDLKTLKSISEYAAIAIQNSKLLQQSIEKEKLEKEIEVAREIQRELLPKEFPKSSVFEFYGLNKPSKQVGGDYFDVFRLNENQILILIADVVGKGIPASLLMANFQASVKALTRLDFDIGNATTILNNLMKQNLSSGNFVTFFWAILDENEKTIKYVNAGHNPPILIRESGIIRLDKGGILLGVLDLTQNYDFEIIQLHKDDLICLFTDGFIEAQNMNEDEFGEERFCIRLREYRNFQLKDIANQLIEEVELFANNSPSIDDLTILLTRVKF